jgi:phage replication O-like protein O
VTSIAPKDAIGNPQIEDGHTRIANELLEAITRFDFSKRQLKVVLFVIRKTYGYNKKADQMSISQISAGTGLNHSATVNAVAELVELGVVSKQYGQHAQLIGLIKQYQSWGAVSNQHPSIKTTIRGVSKQQLGSIKTIPTKDKPKNNTKRNIPDDFSISDRVISWADKNGYTDLERHLENFILACEKGGLKYSNWDSAFMTAIRDNWAKIPAARNNKVVL